jgi:hypothetical protein
LNYFDSNNVVQSNTIQSEVDFSINYTPKRKTIGYGVERSQINNDYSTIFLNYSRGLKGVFNSDFDYDKFQIYYRQPFLLGGFGRTFTTFEAGKTFGEVPLGLLSVVPGNQSYFNIRNTYALLDYYEFVTDTYASVQVEHNFNGRLLSKFPLLRKLNLREVVVFKAVWGEISPENIALNASNLQYNAPEDVYYDFIHCILLLLQAPPPTSGHSAVTIGHHVYIFGGSSDNGLVNSLWIFDAGMYSMMLQ